MVVMYYNILVPISDDFEVRPLAFDTNVNLHIPSTIRGITTTPDISLSFSGDRNGNNEYRWTFVPGDGGRTQSGATRATSHRIAHTYQLIIRTLITIGYKDLLQDILMILL